MSQGLLDEAVWVELFKLQEESAPGLVQGLVDDFFRSVPVSISIMKSALANRDVNVLGMEAHKLKSSCAYLGAAGLRELCIRIEQVASLDGVPEAALLVTRLEADFDQVREQITLRAANA